jgi:hypothetical protein
VETGLSLSLPPSPLLFSPSSARSNSMGQLSATISWSLGRLRSAGQSRREGPREERGVEAWCRLRTASSMSTTMEMPTPRASASELLESELLLLRSGTRATRQPWRRTPRMPPPQARGRERRPIVENCEQKDELASLKRRAEAQVSLSLLDTQQSFFPRLCERLAMRFALFFFAIVGFALSRVSCWRNASFCRGMRDDVPIP